MANVLVLCMSPVRLEGKVREYLIGEERVSGFMTNEAPAKGLIKRLERQGDKLDKIIMICSDKVATDRLTKSDAEKNEKPWFDSECEAMTHVEYLQKVIDEYAGADSLLFEVVHIPDDPKQEEVAHAAVEVARKVLGENWTDADRTNLYIDYNGGQRHVAFMIQSIAKLLQMRQVELKEILVMNFENPREDGVVPIRNMIDIFNSMNLVAGINEYINYGRIKTLDAYFKTCIDKGIREIICAMEEFASDLQLCRTNSIFAQNGSRDRLKSKLDEYQIDTQNHDIMGKLFGYVVEDIRRGYGDMLTGDVPEVIRWCVNKDFVQQALTFCAERMPVYFVQRGIYAPTDEEGEEFSYFLSKGKEPLKDKSNEDIEKAWKAEYLKNYRYADEDYAWFVKYLPNAYRYKFIDREQLCKKRIEHDAKDIAHNYMEYIRIERAKSYIRKDKIKEVLSLYFEIKNQRNLANHASALRENVWDYKTTQEKLLEFVEKVKLS